MKLSKEQDFKKQTTLSYSIDNLVQFLVIHSSSIIGHIWFVKGNFRSRINSFFLISGLDISLVLGIAEKYG